MAQSAGRSMSLKRNESFVAACLSWRNLTVCVNGRDKILQAVTGVAKPGRLLAIVGPSGSGKSTLLDSLAGRLPKNLAMEGEILVNGHNTQLAYGRGAYLGQEGILIGTLTVFETLYYSARLRHPSSTPESEILNIVTAAIKEVGLQDVIDTPIGNWHKRGLSGGEKRRVGIAIQLLTSPPLLFLDEPTSGLDSAAAYHVICTMRRLARGNRTVLCSIHQPSSEVFALFDDLCLLSGGRLVYFGPLPGALQLFSTCGFPSPWLRNPSDHYLMCINADFDKVHKSLGSYTWRTDKQEVQDLDDGFEKDQEGLSMDMPTVGIVDTLTCAYAESEEKESVIGFIENMIEQGGKELDHRGSMANSFTQSYILTVRSFKNMGRDAGYYWLRLLMYSVLCLCLGTIYYRTGQQYTSISARAGCMAFIVAFLTFMSVGGFPAFIEDMKVFATERMNGHYGVAAFVIGNTLSSAPYLLLISVASTIITYFLVDLHGGVDRFFYFLLTLFACLMASESMMMAIASLVPNFLMGIIIGAGFQGIFILVAGFYRLPRDLPRPFWRYPMSYIAFHYYGFQGMMINDFTGLRFENVNPGEPPLTGEYILRNTYQVDMHRSKWLSTLILFVMTVVYRLIFYVLSSDLLNQLFPNGRFAESTLPKWRAAVVRKFRVPTSSHDPA